MLTRATGRPPLRSRILPSLGFVVLPFATSRPQPSNLVFYVCCHASLSHWPPSPSNLVIYHLDALSCFPLPPAPLPSTLVICPLYGGLHSHASIP